MNSNLQEGNLALSAQQGLLLYGEGIGALTSDQIEALRNAASAMVGGLSVEARIMHAESVGGSATEQQTPVPTTLRDFQTFASDNDYPERRALWAWDSVTCVGDRDRYSARYLDNQADPYPAVRFIGEQSDEPHADVVIDLRTVYERLRDSNLSPSAWAKTNGHEKTVRFLVDLVNKKLDVNPPLSV